MTAARLREAAALLRERAEAQVVIDREYGPRRVIGSVNPSRLERLSLEFGLMWTPPVALALADWLDQHESLHSTYDCDFHPCAGVVLADAILGATS